MHFCLRRSVDVRRSALQELTTGPQQTYIVELSPATSRGLLGATVGISLEMGYITAGTQLLKSAKMADDWLTTISVGYISYGISHWLNTNMSWRLPVRQSSSHGVM